MLIGTRTLSSQHVPLPLPLLLPAQLLRDCAEAAATGRFSDAAVDAEVNAAAGGPPLLLRALPGEALFILLTTSRRVATNAPAIVVQLLRAHGFPDARIGSVWESGRADAGGLLQQLQ